MAPTFVMFGDSLCFHGPEGPRPADDPRLWPNVAAAAVGGHAELFAGFGWTARDAYWSLTGDPRVWAQLPVADVLVLAVGGMDTLPSPLPTYLRQGIRYIRRDSLRRRVRATYLAAQPHLARLTRGWPTALPVAASVHYLDQTVEAVRALRPELPAVVVLPGVHRAEAYGYVHTARPAAVAAISHWAADTGVAVLDIAEVVGEHVLGGHGNVDGLHWGWDGHALAGKALAEVVGPLLDPRTNRTS
ncbi:diglucosylglycerate octanoyltransferase [Actinokineospora bangkokensis]|uniref:Lysophospholipase n=1 Tax=Actinokineospora bangkokensis TaxID=1193682 RepID=A0A1Q9LTJ9_9PSEU|nr:diglucosylglycerate octanoyltransferase [Actinokineospora bangkokensis]OLR95358.1 lysophospholipase [Actinokineospora bangkokensis]